VGSGGRIARLGIGALLVAGVLAAALPASAASTPTRGPSGDGVEERTETFVDRTRDTPALSEPKQAKQDHRTLKTTIWSPEEPGTYPLVVFAHGCNGHGTDDAAMLRGWAAAGYVVAAPDFPISSLGTPGVACTSDVAQQPDDVSFVITSVLKLDRQHGSDGLGGIVDRKHIGIAGQSLGAVTTLGTAFRSCCYDKRLDAAISYAGTPLIQVTDFKPMTTPLLLVHGDADPTVRYSGSQSAFNRAKGPRYLLTVLGGDHGTHLQEGTEVGAAVQRTTIDFLDAYLKDDPAALDRIQVDAVVPGATTLQACPTPGACSGTAVSPAP
jgi:dienelactone hydrolase